MAKQKPTFTLGLNPITTSINTVTRTWNDTNGNYVPDCDLVNKVANGECGAVNNTNFGGINPTIHYADEVLNGTRKRGYNWDFTTEVQRQLHTGVSMTAGFYRNWYGNFYTTDNTLVTLRTSVRIASRRRTMHACLAAEGIRSAACTMSTRTNSVSPIVSCRRRRRLARSRNETIFLTSA